MKTMQKKCRIEEKNKLVVTDNEQGVVVDVLLMAGQEEPWVITPECRVIPMSYMELKVGATYPVFSEKRFNAA